MLSLKRSNNTSSRYKLQSINSERGVLSFGEIVSNSQQNTFIGTVRCAERARFERNLVSTMKRKITHRLTINQLSVLGEKYKRWINKLNLCQRIVQQQLYHSLFIPTFCKAQVFFGILTVSFAFLGFLFYFPATMLKQKVIDYGKLCEGQGRRCKIEFELEEDL